jgi:hypothetical protein
MVYLASVKSIILCLAMFLVGCAVPNQQLHTFHFPPGKHLPSMDDTNRFIAIMETLKVNTNATVIVNGNLRPTNQELTDERVWMVVNALYKAGIPAERMAIREPNLHYRSHIPNNQWFTILVVF